MIKIHEMYQDMFSLAIRYNVKYFFLFLKSTVQLDKACDALWCIVVHGFCLIYPVQLGSVSALHITLPHFLHPGGGGYGGGWGHRNCLGTTESTDQTLHITINQDREHETPQWMDTWIINDWAVYRWAYLEKSRHFTPPGHNLKINLWLLWNVGVSYRFIMCYSCFAGMLVGYWYTGIGWRFLWESLAPGKMRNIFSLMKDFELWLFWPNFTARRASEVVPRYCINTCLELTWWS